jgi:class 3 adenylate cyclase
LILHREQKGAHSAASSRKTYMFLPNMKRRLTIPEEDENQNILKMSSLIIIPLYVQETLIGLLDFSHGKEKMQISKSDLDKIYIFCQQIAGVIQNFSLFEEVKKEKDKAIVAKDEVERAKEHIEFLNEFSKVINSFNNLDIIFSHAVENLSKKIDTDVFQLQLVDKTKNELFTRCLSGTDSSLMKKYNKLRVPLIPESGSLYLTYASKKTLYLKNVKRIAEDKKSELDKMVEKDFQIDSVFLIPLLVKDEVIGIMSINQFGGMKRLNKDEIRFVESLCEQLALAVNNSFLLEAAELERAKSEKLLLNILPKDVALELKEKGFAEPVLFENVSVMFTDFKGFTTIAETLSPQELIKDLDACFVQFDKISERFNLEKLKTIGDSYMCAGGIPKRNKTHAIDCCLAALEIQSFMNMMKKLKEEKGFPYWELRLGIHTGPLIAGVIGERKFAYDVWGDTVNTASRMESSGTPGKVNISYTTYELVKDFFHCEYRGEVNAKNKGVVKMYYLERIKSEYAKDEMGLMPNGKFWEMYG